MSEEKKRSSKRETKAGLMEKDSRRATSEKEETALKKDSENTPKMSKDKAENQNDERPIH
jgi:hypothetical protein